VANPEHLRVIKTGGEAWNAWIASHPYEVADLHGADLSRIRLPDGANFEGCDLRGANLKGAWLPKAAFGKKFIPEEPDEYSNLTGANFDGAYLVDANFEEALLTKTNFHDANLIDANFTEANLSRANLIGAHLFGANLTGADLFESDFSLAQVGRTVFGKVDLSHTIGLESLHHLTASFLGVDTVYLSKGLIPTEFLKGVGVPNDFVAFAASLAEKPVEFYSCFISYSTKDEEFARRLHMRMREANMRVWFAPEDLKGGKKLHEQLFEAIQIHDRLLIVLSEHSIQSEWVMTEIRKARETEKKEKRRKLFPIRLTDFETLRDWTCFDADTGKDLAVEVREYFIPDFSNWKVLADGHPAAFEAAFAKLKRDLEAENSRK
jgi:hypothetical protein